MNYFLVDFENVKGAGLQGVSRLGEEDAVTVFYSIHADTLTIDLHQQILESTASFHFQKVSVGSKDALDFQLCSYLGYLIRDTLGKKCNYYIVTNDHGYHVMTEFWKERGIDVVVIESIEKADMKPSTVPSSDKSSRNEKERMLLELLPDKDCVPDVLKIINHYKTKQGVNNGLVKKFASKRAGEIYRAIKPLIADKKGS